LFIIYLVYRLDTAAHTQHIALLSEEKGYCTW
jgi:hypothetical protein